MEIKTLCIPFSIILNTNFILSGEHFAKYYGPRGCKKWLLEKEGKGDFYLNGNDTICPRNSDQFYVVTYYLKWVTTSWTYSMIDLH